MTLTPAELFIGGLAAMAGFASTRVGPDWILDLGRSRTTAAAAAVGAACFCFNTGFSVAVKCDVAMFCIGFMLPLAAADLGQQRRGSAISRLAVAVALIAVAYYKLKGHVS